MPFILLACSFVSAIAFVLFVFVVFITNLWKFFCVTLCTKPLPYLHVFVVVFSVVVFIFAARKWNWVVLLNQTQTKTT